MGSMEPSVEPVHEEVKLAKDFCLIHPGSCGKINPNSMHTLVVS